MPDLFEGVVPFVMKHVVKLLITNNVYNPDELNVGLSSFPFQGTDKKPGHLIFHTKFSLGFSLLFSRYW